MVFTWDDNVMSFFNNHNINRKFKCKRVNNVCTKYAHRNRIPTQAYTLYIAVNLLDFEK